MRQRNEWCSICEQFAECRGECHGIGWGCSPVGDREPECYEPVTNRPGDVDAETGRMVCCGCDSTEGRGADRPWQGQREQESAPRTIRARRPSDGAP